MGDKFRGWWTEIQIDKLERLQNLDGMRPSVDIGNAQARFAVTDMYDNIYNVIITSKSSGYKVSSYMDGNPNTEPVSDSYNEFGEAYRDAKKRLKAIPHAMKFIGAD